MQISKINNVSFGAYVGETEVKYYCGSGIDSSKTIQHIYPFKDEFKSREDQDDAVKAYIHSDSFIKTVSAPLAASGITKNTNDGASEIDGKVYLPYLGLHTAEVVVEDTLPFTKEEYLRARYTPGAENISKEAVNFAAGNHHTTSFTLSGWVPERFTDDSIVK